MESVDLHKHHFSQHVEEGHMLPKKVSWHEEEALTPVHAKSGSRSCHISYCIPIKDDTFIPSTGIFPICRLKGSLTRDFRIRFCHGSVSPGPLSRYPKGAISNFYQNMWKYSQHYVYHQLHRYKRDFHWFHDTSDKFTPSNDNGSALGSRKA